MYKISISSIHNVVDMPAWPDEQTLKAHGKCNLSYWIDSVTHLIDY